MEMERKKKRRSIEKNVKKCGWWGEKRGNYPYATGTESFKNYKGRRKW